MKIADIPKSSFVSNLPRVGEAWRHADSAEVWMRVPDSDGSRLFPSVHSNRFFSVSLHSGNLSHTAVDDRSIELLQPCGDGLRFERM